MVNLNSLLPAVKNLIYNHQYEESTDINKLNALLKFDRVVMEVLADALESKAVNDCNLFFVSDLFRWYSTYVKCFELLIQTSKLVEVSKEEKTAILEMLRGLNDIDDVDEIISRLRGLPVSKNEDTEQSKITIENTIMELKSVFEELETAEMVENKSTAVEDQAAASSIGNNHTVDKSTEQIMLESSLNKKVTGIKYGKKSKGVSDSKVTTKQ